jgi:AcrR family transcriptional regulator
MIAVVQELPLFEAEPKVRADAARNRAKILEAAEALVAELGIEQISMEAVACKAGVGTGTLYRRFGDRAGLALALLDAHAREFQNELIAGEPPLGPGAPARERLRAFGAGYLDLLERHSALMIAATPHEGPHALFATHLTILLQEAAPHLDAHFTAEALLATLAPLHHLRLRHALGWEMDRLREGWARLIETLCDNP